MNGYYFYGLAEHALISSVPLFVCEFPIFYEIRSHALIFLSYVPIIFLEDNQAFKCGGI